MALVCCSEHARASPKWVIPGQIPDGAGWRVAYVSGTFRFYVICRKMKSRRADSNRLSLLITSVRSVVAERCTSLQILYRQGVLCSLHCPLLQGIASGLGSN